MGFFSSVFRFISTMFGLAQGQTSRVTDALVSSSPEAIRAQFRKTRDDWTKDYHDMRDALAQLIQIREQRSGEITQVQSTINSLADKMSGAIELFKKSQDEKYRQAYGSLAAEKTALDKRMDELHEQLDNQNKTIESYKGRLAELQKQIEKLTKEEAETIADIVSSDKIKQLNDRLSGLSTDTQSQNLEAIRDARQKANATAKLSGELSGSEQSDMDKLLTSAGAGSRFLDDFDLAVGLKKDLTEEEKKELEELAKAK